ncbi:hypothetical protein PAHAL_9G363700 [Panicum hallii]|jgi:hypothetical protein|uniref:Uncharacterized protein n=1 Tax=Panicum hallii TaxID=206008 RepID=A0A2S3INZ4_9POAL|nr:hypothetical protein PAHAL_9G363700 [Panicum hallii]
MNFRNMLGESKLKKIGYEVLKQEIGKSTDLRCILSSSCWVPSMSMTTTAASVVATAWEATQGRTGAAQHRSRSPYCSRGSLRNAEAPPQEEISTFFL